MIARLLAVTAALAFCLGPFLWQVLTSFRAEGDLTGWPSTFSVASYGSVLKSATFLRAVVNSLLVATATTVLALAIAAPAAFALSVFRFRGQKILLAFALAISMFPPVATVSPLYLAIRALGLRDTLTGLIIPYATFALPLSLWMLTAFFKELPRDLYRAARIDGCSPFQAFARVLLPLSAPGLATTALLVFIFAWNEFLYALTFTSSPEKRTIPVAISLFAGDFKEPWTEIAAASVLVTVPLIVLTLVFQRRIVAGLTAGSVKG